MKAIIWATCVAALLWAAAQRATPLYWRRTSKGMSVVPFLRSQWEVPLPSKAWGVPRWPTSTRRFQAPCRIGDMFNRSLSSSRGRRCSRRQGEAGLIGSLHLQTQNGRHKAPALSVA